MSGHWKDVIKRLISDPSNELLVNIYCIIKDYHEQKIDTICDDDALRELEKAICEEDPDWAEEEIPDVSRCDNCESVVVEEDLEEYILKENKERHNICEYCYIIHKQHYSKCDEVDDEPIDDMIERHIEKEVDISMGK